MTDWLISISQSRPALGIMENEILPLPHCEVRQPKIDKSSSGGMGKYEGIACIMCLVRHFFFNAVKKHNAWYFFLINAKSSQEFIAKSSQYKTA